VLAQSPPALAGKWLAGPRRTASFTGTTDGKVVALGTLAEKIIRPGCATV
jgi:hypothetical protein